MLEILHEHVSSSWVYRVVFDFTLQYDIKGEERDFICITDCMVITSNLCNGHDSLHAWPLRLPNLNTCSCILLDYVK